MSTDIFQTYFIFYSSVLQLQFSDCALMSHLRKNITLCEKDAGTTKSLKTSLSLYYITIMVDTEHSVIIDNFKVNSQQCVE